jgi:hypothetical protein
MRLSFKTVYICHDLTVWYHVCKRELPIFIVQFTLLQNITIICGITIISKAIVNVHNICCVGASSVEHSETNV